jgi:hypothetical protein
MALGESRSYSWLCNSQISLGNYSFGTGSVMRVGLGNNIVIGFTGGTLIYNFAVITYGVIYVTYQITKLANSGTALEMFDVKMFINGKRVNQIATSGTSTNSVPNNTQTIQRFNLGMLNSSTFNNNGFSSRINFFSMHNRIITFKEIRELHLGRDPLLTSPLYHYDFTSVTPLPAGNKLIPNTGSGTIDAARLENADNITRPLFT